MRVTLLSVVLATAALADGVTLPKEWSACTRDEDCTYVSLGCCDTTPVNRARERQAQKKLNESGRPVCPPKTACGPSEAGTWKGTPGRCVARRCAMPKLAQ